MSLEGVDETPGVHLHPGEAKRRHSKMMATHRPGDEASAAANPAGTLVLDSQPPEPGVHQHLLLKPPGVWYLTWHWQSESTLPGRCISDLSHQ